MYARASRAQPVPTCTRKDTRCQLTAGSHYPAPKLYAQLPELRPCAHLVPNLNLVHAAHVERDVLPDALGCAEYVAVRLNHLLCADDAVPRRAVRVNGEVRDVPSRRPSAGGGAGEALETGTHFIAVASLKIGVVPSGAYDSVPGVGSV
mgnify:CR=1 FL=1